MITKNLNITVLNISYKSDENFYGVIWNDGTYVYDIYGSLTKSDIIKVAKCTK